MLMPRASASKYSSIGGSWLYVSYVIPTTTRALSHVFEHNVRESMFLGKVRLREHPPPLVRVQSSPSHFNIHPYTRFMSFCHLYTYARLFAHAIATFCAHRRPMICFSRQVRHLTFPRPLSHKAYYLPHPKALKNRSAIVSVCRIPAPGRPASRGV